MVSPPSSSSASILMTLAPQSASCRTQVGPARTRVRSSTVKRERACEARGKAIQTTPHRTADKSSLWVSSIINSIADRRPAVMGKQLSDLIAMQAAVPASELIGHRGVTQARQAVILTDHYKIGTLQILFRRSLKG